MVDRFWRARDTAKLESWRFKSRKGYIYSANAVDPFNKSSIEKEET